MGGGSVSITEQFQMSPPVSLTLPLQIGPATITTQTLPSLGAIAHYGDVEFRRIEIDHLSPEQQELYLVTTRLSRYLSNLRP